jgi:hypothetical protein
LAVSLILDDETKQITIWDMISGECIKTYSIGTHEFGDERLHIEAF